MNKKETNVKNETVIAASPYYLYCQRCVLLRQSNRNAIKYSDL